MKKKEIKKLTEQQSLKEFEKLKKDLFNIRFQKVNGQIKNPSKISFLALSIFFLQLFKE